MGRIPWLSAEAFAVPWSRIALLSLSKLAGYADKKCRHLTSRGIEIAGVVHQPHEDVLCQFSGLHAVARHVQSEPEDSGVIGPVKLPEGLTVTVTKARDHIAIRYGLRIHACVRGCCRSFHRAFDSVYDDIATSGSTSSKMFFEAWCV